MMYMLKKGKSHFLLLLVLTLGVISCQKEEVDVVNTLNEVTIANPAKGKQTGTITIKVGHSAKECNGCIPVGDKLVHVDCQGAGTLCEITARVSI